MNRLLLIILAVALIGVPHSARATLPVIDYAHIATTVADQVVNYVQYIDQTLSQWEQVAQNYTQIANQLTQITNQVTQIENQLTQLARFGNPQTYVNLLHLDQFLNTANTLSAGVGRTVGQFQATANGFMALRYTAQGLYSDLSTMQDRFGNAVQFNQNNFRKFGIVNDMYDAYNTELQTYNQTNANLHSQLNTALANLNAASTQMESDKYAAQVNAISAQINSLGHRTNQVGQRLLVQQAMNQNDAARYQEAEREQRIQERELDLQNLSKSLSRWVSGGQSGN
jgi:hypothetical protein